MMTFEPKKHLIKLQGKDYLEVKWRIVWFRDDHEAGTIDTDLLTYEPGLAIVKATVAIDGKVLATGIANADSRQKKAMWSGKEIMKAETAAIGRALAHAGYGTQFTGEVEDDFLADSPVDNNNTMQQTGAETIPWPSKEQVGWVTDKFRDLELTWDEIFELAGVTALDDGDGWRKYKDAQAAVLAMEAAFDNVTTSPQSNGEMTGAFNFMNYIGKTSNMQFMMNKPGAKLNTTAVLYGGRGAIRKWGGDELYEQLNLSQYDAIKGKGITSAFIEMPVRVDFHFVSKQRNGAEYFEIVGIEGDPTIRF